MVEGLENAAALVVGGTAGIGFASAEALLDARLSRLAIASRSIERGTEARDRLAARYPHASIAFFRCDATKPRELQSAVDETAAWTGGIDILVSSAGGDPRPRLLHQIPLDDVFPTIEAAAAGIILPARAVLTHMRERGRGSVICFASDAAKVATPGESVIGAAMAAITMFCRGMAIEAKRSGVRVNCITPSIVRDTLLYHRLQEDEFCRKLFGKAETLANLGVATPSDLAALVVFLASPAAARITGQTISVTGGISAV